MQIPFVTVDVFTDRAIIVERDSFVHAAGSAALAADRAALETHLGVTDQGPCRGGVPTWPFRTRRDRFNACYFDAKESACAS